jgi:hypothetical protein
MMVKDMLDYAFMENAYFFGNADEERSRNTSTSTTLPKHDRIDELGSAINAREKNNVPFLFLHRNAVSIKKNITLVSIITRKYFVTRAGRKQIPPFEESDICFEQRRRKPHSKTHATLS